MAPPTVRQIYALAAALCERRGDKFPNRVGALASAWLAVWQMWYNPGGGRTGYLTAARRRGHARPGVAHARREEPV